MSREAVSHASTECSAESLEHAAAAAATTAAATTCKCITRGKKSMGQQRPKSGRTYPKGPSFSLSLVTGGARGLSNPASLFHFAALPRDPRKQTVPCVDVRNAGGGDFRTR